MELWINQQRWRGGSTSRGHLGMGSPVHTWDEIGLLVPRRCLSDSGVVLLPLRQIVLVVPCGSVRAPASPVHSAVPFCLAAPWWRDGIQVMR